MATQVKALDSAELTGTSAQGLPRGELAFFHAKSGKRTAWLEFIDQAATYPKAYRDAWGKTYEPPEDEYWVPLGKVESVPKDQDVPQADLELMPVYPVRFADAAGTSLRHLREGWLYLFLDGHLWRELCVDRTGWAYREVNLARHQGEDKRPTSVQVERNTVVLPYRMDGQTPTIEIAFSEVQWSWGYICTLGAMAGDDPRYLAELQIHEPYQQISPSAEHRQARCQRIDLSAYHAGDGADRVRETSLMSVEAALAANNHPTGKDGYRRPRLRAFGEEDARTALPVLALQDPLGIAMDNLKAYYTRQADLIQCVAEINDPKEDPYRESAVLAYHTFFDEDLWHKDPRKGSAKVASYSEDSDAAQILRKAAKSIDQTYLKDLLRVDKRKQVRADLRDLKRRHVLWLEGKVEPPGAGHGDQGSVEDATQRYRQFVSVDRALLDYAGLPAPDYLGLHSAVYALIHLLSHDPGSLDGRYDLAKDRDATPPDKDPGTQYLDSLLKPSNPLHAMLFPSRDQVDEFRADYDIQDKKPEQPSADGMFRPAVFAASVAAANPRAQMPAAKLAEGIVKDAEKLIADIILVFQRQWKKAAAGKTEFDIDALVRLGKAANTPEMKGMRLIEKGESLKGYVVVDGQLTILEQLKRAQRREAFEKAVKNPAQGDRVNVIDPKTGKAVFSTDLANLPNNTGWPMSVSDESWSELWARKGEGDMAYARGRFVAVPDDAPYAAHWHVPDAPASADVKATVSLTSLGSKTLPPVVAVIELFNLIRAIEAFRASATAREKVSLFVGWFALPYAIIDATAKSLGDDRAVRFWTRAFGGSAKAEAAATRLLKDKITLPLARELGSLAPRQNLWVAPA